MKVIYSHTLKFGKNLQPLQFVFIKQTPQSMADITCMWNVVRHVDGFVRALKSGLQVVAVKHSTSGKKKAALNHNHPGT